MSPLTVPEVRRLLLARDESPLQRRLRAWWSAFRRQHQATARRCHAERRAREQPPVLTGASLRLCSVTCTLDDALWEEIAPLLPAARQRGDEPPLVYRVMLEGILWVARTGASWHDLPAAFGPWETVHATYYRWKQHGHWLAVLALLQAAATAPS